MTIDASSMSSEPGPPRLRFGRASQAGSDPCSVQWELRRNCSLTPRQMLGFYLGLSGISLGIAGIFWWLGATLVMPFAWLEVLAVGGALLVHARHVSDRESIRVQGGVLTVERACGAQTERCEFCAEWVRVQSTLRDGSLIELCERGRKVRVGRFVRPELRRQLADEMRWVLRRHEAVQGLVPGSA